MQRKVSGTRGEAHQSTPNRAASSHSGNQRPQSQADLYTWLLGILKQMGEMDPEILKGRDTYQQAQAMNERRLRLKVPREVATALKRRHHGRQDITRQEIIEAMTKMTMLYAAE
jgi:hypothetical protein